MADRPDILLIGAAGMLGRAWRELLARGGITVDTPSREMLDITDAAALAQAIHADCRIVINCAAWTAVDDAEEQEAAATRINGDAVASLAAACDAVGAQLVHYSTDYVFPGDDTTPYAVDRSRDPINAYGRSKAVGEIALERPAGRHLIIRTSWLYAPWGNNFVRTIAGAARKHPTLRVVDDQRGRPTSSEHLADATWRLIQAGASGIYHVCDGGEATWFDFAEAIAARVNPDCTVHPCTSDEYPRPAARPAYSVLDMSTTESLIGPMRHWRENLGHVLDRLDTP